MMPSNELYPDLLGTEATPSRKRLIADLDHAYHLAPPPAHVDAAVMQAVHQRARRHGQPQRARRSWPVRRRLAAVVASLALIAGGALAYVGSQSPTPASAQAVLYRAAAAVHLAPSHAAHFVYTISTTGGYTGTGDVWIQTDASGAASLSAQTLSLFQNGVAAPNMNDRLVRMGQQTATYNPRDNTITIMPGAQDSNGLPTDVFDGTRVAQYLSALTQGPHPGVQLLPPQTLDGHTVDVVEFGWNSNSGTFYFDAQSYLLRGFDLVDAGGRSWHARLSAYDTMPAAAVPPHIFALNAPATARVVAAESLSPLVSLCNVERTFKTKGALMGKSPLQVCQAGNPAMTQAALVAALAAPIKAELDAAVAAGQITPAQEADSFAALKTRLASDVITPFRAK